MAGADLYTIVDAAEASEPLGRGLYRLEMAAEGKDAQLFHLPTGKVVGLSKVAQTSREDGDIDLRATGYRLRLRHVGVSRLSAAEWEEIQTAFSGHTVEVVRVPAGSVFDVIMDAVEPGRGGATLRYHERGKEPLTLQFTSANIAAYRWAEGVLEVRNPVGAGVRIRLRRCATCRRAIESARNVHLVGDKELCTRCQQRVTRAARSAAQKKVGVCRGCVFYGLAISAEERVSVCLSQARVRRFGQITEDPVAHCAYRKLRRAGAPRRVIDLTNVERPESGR